MKWINLSFVLFVLVIVAGISDRFLAGIWGFGVILSIAGLMMFNNLRVEAVRELVWNRGLRS